MHPVLFELGGLEIHTYGALGALAFVVGCALVLWRSHRLGLDFNQVADVIFWMAVSGLIGARLIFVLQQPSSIDRLGDLFDLRRGGLVFYGSFVVGIPAGFLLMWRSKLPIFAMWDIFGTAWPLSHAISRVGCFAAGCCWGLPSAGALATTFPEDSPLAPGGVPLHPVQLYEAAALLGIAGITNLFYRHRRFDGQVCLLYLLLYAVVRSITEEFRGDLSRGYFLPELLGRSLSYSQGMSLVLAVVALAVFLVGARRASEPTQ
ncbi:MAG TPA: prolipoprotein diacylglyceryl transferase [Deltaproteobacteria bacterium]|nr:prolipoprotein diacylglyceryl transferase [Deltaproteobacteria bacterium]